MTVEEVQKLKKLTESAIKGMLNEFEKQTGCQITDIEIHDEVTTVGEGINIRQEVNSHVVDLTVEVV